MASKLKDKGAPAVAERLESHEQDAESKVNRLREDIDRLEKVIPQLDGDTERQQIERNKLDMLNKDLIAAYKLWMELAKQVRDYYKAVDASKRDGEKIPRAEVERLLENTWRFQRKGRESFIVAIAQDAIHCKDEQAFYSKYAENIRECEVNMIRAGIEHEKFPTFVAECYERSL